MSARNAVYSELMWPEWNSTSESHGTSDAVANELLDAYRAEVLREAAEKIRAELPEVVKERLGGGIWTITTVPTAKQAADLIDPDTPEPPLAT